MSQNQRHQTENFRYYRHAHWKNLERTLDVVWRW